MASGDEVSAPSARPDGRPAALAPPRAPEVHVWRFAVGRGGGRLRDLLSVGERQRADRFRFPRDRERFVARRAVRRLVLARYVGAEAAALEFGEGDRGKPFLAGAYRHSGLRFNASMSDDVALLAVTQGREVGVDIERIRPDFDFTGIAEHELAPEESAALSRLPEERRRRAFYEIWSSKEAWLKATGTGLSFPLEAFAVAAPGDDAPRLLRRCGEAGGVEWSFALLSVGEDYAACVVSEGAQEVKLRDWSGEVTA